MEGRGYVGMLEGGVMVLLVGVYCVYSAGKLLLPDVAALLDREVLHKLKKECGGLQTLLRNQHQVFRGRPWWIDRELSMNI